MSFHVFLLLLLTGSRAAPEGRSWYDPVWLQPADGAPRESSRAPGETVGVDVEASSASPGSAAAGCLAGRPALPEEPAGKTPTHEAVDGSPWWAVTKKTSGYPVCFYV